MKKLFCTAVCFLLVFCMLTVSVSAAAGVSVKNENPLLQKGEKVSLTVSLNAERHVQAFQYRLEYDADVLDFVSVSGGMYNLLEKGKIMYINVGSSSTDTVTFVFKTKKAGETTVRITDVAAADSEEYSFPSCDFTFNIDIPTRGDCDGNGAINTSDLAELKLYLAGADGSVSDNADYNKDSVINTSDLASLKQYLAEG